MMKLATNFVFVRAEGRLKKPIIMGVLNVTPNSFSDGNCYITVETARQRALEMVRQGAEIIDIGGEASNPYRYAPVSIDEELSRVIPVIEAIRNDSDVFISIDTHKAFIMREAVHAGASMINDIMALRGPDSLETAKELGVPVCLMHMQGTPDTMQHAPEYSKGVVAAIHDFFHQRIQACLQAGMKKEQLILDPGIGFGKSQLHNLNILKETRSFTDLDYPILFGVSRKKVIGEALSKPIEQRMLGGVAIAVYLQMQGVHIIRTHDVDETNQALTMVSHVLHD